MWSALGWALKRGILGKSSHDYIKQFARDDEYDCKAAANQQGLPNNGIRSPEPEYEPVHGWSQRQCDEYLTRNPDYRSAYNAELPKHKEGPREGNRTQPIRGERRKSWTLFMER